MLRPIFVLFSVLSVAACAGVPDGEPNAEGEKKEVCRTVKESGSNIPVRVCRKL